jgi:hypothetical protein
MTRSHAFLAAAVWAALNVSACGSDDASLGRNRGASNPSGGSGGSAEGGSVSATGGSPTAGGSSAGSSSGGGLATGGGPAAGSSSGGGLATGGGPADCEMFQCIRPIECVETCGGPVLKSGCCPCDSGTFDSIECGVAPPELNSECVDHACPDGLSPVHFYGIAGPSGPEFCWCTIPCADDPAVCPGGTSCVTIADGPGTVCYAD